MALPRRLLSPGEHVIVETRPHWVFLGWPLVASAASITTAVVVAALVPDLPLALGYALIALVVLCVLWLTGRTIRWLTTNVVLTTQRLSERSGVLARHGFDVRLDRIGELSYRQSLGQRLLRTGEVVVSVADDPGVVVLRCVRDPRMVSSAVTNAAASWHRISSTPHDALHQAPAGVLRRGSPDPDDTPPAGSGVVVDSLEQLDLLRRRGLISASEFTAKRAELLSRL